MDVFSGPRLKARVGLCWWRWEASTLRPAPRAPWDPLELAKVTGDAMDVETRLRWFWQADIKHGRVCMAAFVGWIFSANGGAFPGMEQYIGASPPFLFQCPPRRSLTPNLY